MLNGGRDDIDEHPEIIIFLIPTMNMLPWMSGLYAGSGRWGNKERNKTRGRKVDDQRLKGVFVFVFNFLLQKFSNK